MEATEITIGGIKYPFYTQAFIDAWGLWLRHRVEIKKPIKGKVSQQAALKKIAKLADGNEETAIAIIEQSLENNWRGLFALKTLNASYESITKNTDADLIAALKRRFED
jgi:hypothetical protein